MLISSSICEQTVAHVMLFVWLCKTWNVFKAGSLISKTTTPQKGSKISTFLRYLINGKATWHPQQVVTNSH